jgi:hypothetical protein
MSLDDSEKAQMIAELLELDKHLDYIRDETCRAQRRVIENEVSDLELTQMEQEDRGRWYALQCIKRDLDRIQQELMAGE